MSGLKDHAERLQQDIGALLESQARYYKLWSFKAGMKSLSLLLNGGLVAALCLIALFFFAMAAAFALAAWFDSMTLGFLAAGAILLALALLVHALRRHIERPLLRRFSDIFFTD